MRSLPLALLIACMAGIAVAQQTPAPDSGPPFGIHNAVFTVRLLSPISTTTSRAGDAFTAAVVSPESYANAIMEGRISRLKAPQKGFEKGNSELQLEFDSISWNGRSQSITADLREVTNSKGVRNVDDEGHVVAHSSGKKRLAGAAGGAAIGALVGALRGGAGGSIVGAAAGALAGYIITAKLTSTNSTIELRPGSLFTLEVSDSSVRHQTQ